MDTELLKAISFLWKGMLGIFAFMFLFYGIITGLDRIFVKNSVMHKFKVKVQGIFHSITGIFTKK